MFSSSGLRLEKFRLQRRGRVFRAGSGAHFSALGFRVSGGNGSVALKLIRLLHIHTRMEVPRNVSNGTLNHS